MMPGDTKRRLPWSTVQAKRNLVVFHYGTWKHRTHAVCPGPTKADVVLCRLTSPKLA